MNHEVTIQRRQAKHVDEQRLISDTDRLNITFGGIKPANLLRRARELASFLRPPQAPKSGEEVGRTSGSEAWRSARGEIRGTRDSTTGHVFDVLNVRYSAVNDKYYDEAGDVLFLGWQRGVWKVEGAEIARKVEYDWNMAYLARAEGTPASSASTVSWKWKLPKGQDVSRVQVTFSSTVFHSGLCSVKLLFEKDDGVLASSTDFRGDKLDHVVTERGVSGVVLQVTLSSGEGNSGWQHAQLFRQDMKVKHFVNSPFHVIIHSRDD